MQTFFIIVAFVFGFISRLMGLPPLVGFLTAGFFLNFMGYETGDMLHRLADVGIILLLFSIGLKVQVKKLIQPQVWATASIHMGITTIILGAVVFTLSLGGLPYFYRLGLGHCFLLAFALSFSSTVFAVKILEEQEEMASRHGQLAIGILVMQDLMAVLFITFSSGEFPSPFALALLCLFFLRKPLEVLLNKSGHGELLVLLACILPVAGAVLFKAVGLKPDLGALVLGMLLAGTPKSDELAKSMLGFKDLFLVCFFLSIGMDERPHLEMILHVVLLLAFIPLKTAFLYRLLTFFRLRARTALFTSFNLANYSEFGLIVGSIGVSQGMLSREWLVIIALAVSLSMIGASPLAKYVSSFYSRFQERLKKYESEHRLKGDELIDIGDAQVAVLGLGRVGKGVFDDLESRYNQKIAGLDFDEERVASIAAKGKNVFVGDATEYDFWQRCILSSSPVDLVFLAMSHRANCIAAQYLRQYSHSGVVASIIRHDDEYDELKAHGVHYVFNIYDEAGSGFSRHVCTIAAEDGHASACRIKP